MRSGELRFTADKSFAADGSALTIALQPEPELPEDLGNAIAGSAFTIGLTTGEQPRTPVTVSMPVEGSEDQGAEPGDDLPDEPLAFLTRSTAATPWEGRPVTVRDGTATVELDHFSEGFFVKAKPPGLVQTVTDYLQLTYPLPDCSSTVENAGATLAVAAEHPDFIKPCVSVSSDGVVTVTIHSNSPNVWLVRDLEGAAKALPPPRTPDPSTTVIKLVHEYGPGTPEGEAILTPGSNVTFTLPKGTTEAQLNLELSAAYGLINILWRGVIMWLGPAGASADWENIIATGECLADAMTLSDQAVDARWVATKLPALLGCASTYLKTMGHLGKYAEFAIGLVTSLASLLAAQLYGLYTVAATNLGNTAVNLTSAVTSELSSGGWPTTRHDSNGPVHMWLGAASAWGKVSIGFPDWLACAGQTCVAGDGKAVSVIGRSNAGYYEAGTFPADADAGVSLKSLGLPAATIAQLLKP